MHRQNHDLFADYFQIYLCDDELQPFLPEDVTDEDIFHRLRVAPHIMVIHTARDRMVPVGVEVHPSDPGFDPAAWDDVTECSLEVPAGRLVLAGCTDYLPDCPRVELPAPGTYRVRTLHGGLDTLRDNDLEGDDHYLFQLWPAPFQHWQVIKQRPQD